MFFEFIKILFKFSSVKLLKNKDVKFDIDDAKFDVFKGSSH